MVDRSGTRFLAGLGSAALVCVCAGALLYEATGDDVDHRRRRRPRLFRCHSLHHLLRSLVCWADGDVTVWAVAWPWPREMNTHTHERTIWTLPATSPPTPRYIYYILFAGWTGRRRRRDTHNDRDRLRLLTAWTDHNAMLYININIYIYNDNIIII